MITKEVIIKLLKVISFLTFVVLLGSFGYQYIEGYSFIDAVYMTVITLTTTGFGEVQPLGLYGKIFTMVLLFTGMGVVTYSLSSIVSYIASIDFSKRRREKMEKKIESFKNHCVVCGFGRMGSIICKRLYEKGVQFVVIEKNPHLISQLQKTDYFFIEGDAANDENLVKAGIEKAKFLVSVIDSDADGLYIALAGRSFNPDLQITVRANEANAERRMKRAGANKVILPFLMSGMKVAEYVINPNFEDLFQIPNATQGEMEYMQVADIHVDGKSKLAGRSLLEVGPELEGVIVVGVRKKDQSFKFKPESNYIFEIGDCLVTMGQGDTQQSLKSEFKATA